MESVELRLEYAETIILKHLFLTSNFTLHTFSGGKQMKSDLPERTFRLAVQIVELCKLLDEKPGVSRTLVNQLLRSGTSVGANVQEGQSSQSEADFLAKYNIACKEARETHYWLKLLVATQLVQENKVKGLIDECNQILAILTVIVKKLKAKKNQCSL